VDDTISVFQTDNPETHEGNWDTNQELQLNPIQTPGFGSYYMPTTSPRCKSWDSGNSGGFASHEACFSQVGEPSSISLFRSMNLKDASSSRLLHRRRPFRAPVLVASYAQSCRKAVAEIFLHPLGWTATYKPTVSTHGTSP
jgi:hypothetical protein